MFQRALIIFEKTILLLTFIFTGFIFLLNINATAETDLITFDEQVEINYRNPFISIMLTIVCILILGIGILAYQKAHRQIKQIVLCSLLLLVFATCVALARNNPYPPNADQQMVWDMACYLAGYSQEMPYEYIPAYWIKYPQQQSIAVLMGALIRITHNASPYYFRLINCLSLAMYMVGLYIITELLFHNDSISHLAGIMGICFMPVYFYVNYVYSTLITMTTVLWGFILLLHAIHYTQKTVAVLEMLAAGILLAYSNVFYKGTLIATVAVLVFVCFFLLENNFHLDKARFIGIIIVLLLSLVIPAINTRICQNEFESKTGICHEGGIPMTGWLLMGISSEEGVNGPGSYDGVSEFIFAENQYNSDATSKAIQKELRIVIEDYLKGRRKANFFFEKSIIQWCDPWFASATMTFYPDLISENEGNSLYSFIIDSGALKYVQLIFSYFLPIIAASAAIAMMFLLKSPGLSISLPTVFFIGGFVFQFFWESKSRYCLPYFFMLIPFSSYGIYRIAEGIRNSYTPNRMRKC